MSVLSSSSKLLVISASPLWASVATEPYPGKGLHRLPAGVGEHVDDRRLNQIDSHGAELLPGRPGDPIGQIRIIRHAERHVAAVGEGARPVDVVPDAPLLVDGDEHRNPRHLLGGIEKLRHFARLKIAVGFADQFAVSVILRVRAVAEHADPVLPDAFFDFRSDLSLLKDRHAHLPDLLLKGHSRKQFLNIHDHFPPIAAWNRSISNF